MKRRLSIGLTGGIGSGKTEALRRFSALGALTISLDEIARKQACPGGSAFLKIVRAFGRQILDDAGLIDRKKLASQVFSNSNLRKRLEGLTHPLILKEMLKQIKALSGIVIVDVPLLFEGNHEKYFDATLAVLAPVSERFRRVLKRDCSSPLEIRNRMSAQISDRDRKNRADVVIDNKGDFAAFYKKISQYYQAFYLITKKQG